MRKRLRFFCVFTQQAINSRHSKKHSEKYYLLTTFKGGGNSFNNLLRTFALHTF